jgi:hypothetical protein
LRFSVILRFLALLPALALSPAAADDLRLPEPSLQMNLPLADFGSAGSTDLRRWASLSEHVGFEAAGPGSACGPGPGLRVSYDLPAVAKPLDLPEAEGEFGVRLELGGVDASAFDHLAFEVKGDPATGFEREFELQLRRPDPAGGPRTEIGAVRVGGVGPEWKRFEIPLNHFIGLRERRGLAAWVLAFPTREMGVRRGAYCLRGLALVKTGETAAGPGDIAPALKKEAWMRAAGGEAAARTLLRTRLAGWPAAALVDPKTLPGDDAGFLWRLAADTWRGVDALTDKAHGLPLDRVEFAKGSVAPESARIGDYTNITNIGMHFLAVTAAHQLGFVDRAGALERLAATLSTMESLETHRGFFFNYYNTTTLERTSHFVSFVDSAWLTAGLIVARQAFPELAARATRLVERQDYGFFYDADLGLMSHGYYANAGLRSPFHYGVFYSESRLGSLVAIGRGQVPEEHWFRMARTFPPEIQWQTRPPLGRAEQAVGGFRWIGGHYRWREFSYVPSWGGSLFEALMPRLVLDEARHAPASLGRNGALHSLIHRRFALEDLGYPVWGMSPSSTPGSAAYSEYGVRQLGMAGYKSGVVTPHAAALALLAEPAEATANLRRLAERFPVYGDFGFYDAVNPGTGEISYNYLCLNQAMILVSLANHLDGHGIQKLFATDPVGAKILPLVGIEKFND